MNISKQFISYNRSYRNNSIRYIVIHSTGNTNDTAQNNHDYFASCDRGASADWFVDDYDAIQIIDSDNYYSWHCGDGHGRYGISNSNSIGIEMCGTADGYISEQTITNTIELVKMLQNKYGIDDDHVKRHYDASYKCCPSQFSSNNWTRWWDFKSRLNGKYKIGWTPDENGWYYSPDGNTYCKNEWQYIDGYYYYFNDLGYAKTGWYQDEDSRWYYLSQGEIKEMPQCAMVTGWLVTNKGTVYLSPIHDEENGLYIGQCLQNITYNIDGNWYKFDEKGYLEK